MMDSAATPVAQRLRAGLERVVAGNEGPAFGALVALLAGGHLLLEGVPGTAKTLLVRVLARLLGAGFKRIQFTPDLMPSDIVGTTVFDPASGTFALRRGPIFTNLVLADEINRTPPKTQSALLEAMDERQVTIDGESHPIAAPFFVCATQNPIEFEGTYPLPEAQLDRFIVRARTGYPSEVQERALLARTVAGFDAHDLAAAGVEAVVSTHEIVAAQQAVRAIHVEPAVQGYILALALGSRAAKDVALGVSPRGVLAFLAAAQAAAAIDARAFVTPDDVKTVAPLVLAHRIIVRPEAELEGATAESIVARLLGSVTAPAVNALRRVRPPVWLGPRGIAVAIVFALAAGALARILVWPLASAVALAGFVLLALADARASAAHFGLRRDPPERYALARADAFAYTIENRGSVALRCGVVEAPVDKLAIDAGGASAIVPPHARAQAEIAFVPRERGRTALGDSYAWYETLLGIVRHRVRLAGAQPIRILPDLGVLEATDDLAVRARSIDAGLRRLRRRGSGTEFESLREYSAGDAFRDIDWKATARRGRVMVAQHEVERSQQVIVAIDAGRLMAARLGDRRKLDYAITAALGIAGLARRAADRVGVHAFASTTLATVKPGSGTAQAAAIVEALADIEPHFDEPDYERAALELRRAYRKRSLIVVFTDLFDPVASSGVLAALNLLVRSHLVLVVLMNDAALIDALAAEPRDVSAAYRAALATSLAAERARAVAQLHAGGMLVVDVPARELQLATLDAYLAIKTHGLL